MKSLLKRSIRPYVVAIGREPEKWDILNAVFRDGDVFPVGISAQLLPQARLIAKKIVVRTGTKSLFTKYLKHPSFSRPLRFFRYLLYYKEGGSRSNVLFCFLFEGAPPDFIADIIFVIDSSSEVSLIDFEREKGFVKQMSRLLNMNKGQSRIALITYGKNSQISFRLNEFKDIESFDNAVDQSSFVGGQRRIELVIPSIKKIFSEARLEVSK